MTLRFEEKVGLNKTAWIVYCGDIYIGFIVKYEEWEYNHRDSELSSQELREIADKLDELNGVDNGTTYN